MRHVPHIIENDKPMLAKTLRLQLCQLTCRRGGLPHGHWLTSELVIQCPLHLQDRWCLTHGNPADSVEATPYQRVVHNRGGHRRLVEVGAAGPVVDAEGGRAHRGGQRGSGPVAGVARRLGKSPPPPCGN